ncbi:cytochrome c oxidase accessory protein CcoG [bacterium]|nr:cytochrome c oxidase accessory protein CcoG [bacterium]
MSKNERSIKSQENFRNRLSSVDDKGKRIFIFPKLIKGRFYKYRTYFSWFLLVIMFGLPFIKYNGRPFIMLNVLERKFIIFGTVFWPQDFILFLLAIISLILFIILFTVVFGRLFCGWACPQTVFMEMVFRKIEYWIDGNAVQQKRLAKAPWDGDKIKKRLLKYTIFIAIAFIIGNLLMAYIVGVDETFTIITSSPTENWTGFMLVLAFTGITFFNFAYFREQTCIVVCPYGRIQGVLLDQKSIVVAYDHQRGEPRELPKKQRSENAGDCIDCYACVDVCPTGIDIRNGTQLECVNCTACIDACDEVMDKIHKPRGLIRYASEHDIEHQKETKINARAIAYSIVLALIVGILSFLLTTRPEVQATIIKSRGTLYSVSDDNYVKNVFNVAIVNKTYDEFPIELKMSDDWNARLKVVGNQIVVAPESITEGIFYLEIPMDKLPQKSTEVGIQVWSGNKMIEEVDVMFLRP